MPGRRKKLSKKLKKRKGFRKKEKDHLSEVGLRTEKEKITKT